MKNKEKVYNLNSINHITGKPREMPLYKVAGYIKGTPHLIKKEIYAQRPIDAELAAGFDVIYYEYTERIIL
jgi:hypothetical protein